MKILPIGKRVLIKKIEIEEKRASGLLLLSNNSDKNYETGTIIAISSDKEIQTLFSLHSNIIFKKNSGIHISSDDEILLNLDDILGIIEN